jgi:hypothetical protein
LTEGNFGFGSNASTAPGWAAFSASWIFSGVMDHSTRSFGRSPLRSRSRTRSRFILS